MPIRCALLDLPLKLFLTQYFSGRRFRFVVGGIFDIGPYLQQYGNHRPGRGVTYPTLQWSGGCGGCGSGGGLVGYLE